MKEKIKQFKELKENLKQLYELQEKQSTKVNNVKKKLNDTLKQISDLENELGIPRMHNDIYSLNKKIEECNCINQIVEHYLEIEESKPNPLKTLAFPIFMLIVCIFAMMSVGPLLLPFPLSICSYVIGMLSLCVGTILVTSDVHDIFKHNHFNKELKEFLDQLKKEKANMLESKKLNEENIEKSKGDSKLTEFYSKRDDFEEYYAEANTLLREVNDMVSFVESQYNSLGLEIATELLSMSDKESLLNEDIAPILPELKAILEAQEVEKQANKILLQ